MVFTHWPREDSFPVSRALGGTCRRWSRFCKYFANGWLTPLHFKITRSKNLLSVCRRKLKLSTYLQCIDISFLNTRSQLIWVLGTAGSSGFYSITSSMISRNSFWKTASIQRRKTFFPCRYDIFRFFDFYSLVNRPRLPRIFIPSNE